MVRELNTHEKVGRCFPSRCFHDMLEFHLEGA